MDNEKQRKTFLSYSRVNTDFAKRLAKELKAEGFPVWLDQLDIPLGARWDVELEKALEECEIFMIIMTPASINSENVRDEIGYAIDNGKRFLPIMLENCNVPLRLRRFQYVDFTNKEFDDGVESAKRLLRGLIEQNTIPRGKIADVTQDKEAKAEAKRLSKQKVEPKQAEQKDETSSFAAEREKVLRASSLMKQGSQLLQDKDYLEAVQAFREILTLMPNHEKTLALLAKAEAGMLKERESSNGKAKEEADQLTAQKAEDERIAKAKAESDGFKASRENVIKASDLLAQGKKLLENGSLAEAARIFRQVLTLIPNHPETKSLLADVESQVLQESDELAAKAKADTEHKAKQETDRLAVQKEEADKLAKQKAEDERLAKVEAETEGKAKEPADRLATQKAEADKLARQEAEDEAERKAKEETDRLAAQEAEIERAAKHQVEVDRIARAKPTPVGQVNEKATGKKSMPRGIVIGGVVAVVLCIVAVIAIGSWANNTVSPTDTPLKVTATKPKSTATNVLGSTKTPTKKSPTLTPNIPITTLEGTWIGKMDEIEGDDRIYDVRLSVNQSLTGEVVLDGPNHEVYSIVEGSWDGYNFWFKDDQELYWWGTYENGHLIGGWGPGLEYLYWYTFDLTR